MLDKVQKTSKDTPAELSSAAISTIDVAELRALAYQGDPVASALLGSCIWRGLITAEDKEGRCVSLEDEEISIGENPSFLPTSLNFSYGYQRGNVPGWRFAIWNSRRRLD